MAAIRTGTVKVDGLRELNAALRDLGGNDLAKELTAASRQVAEFVAADAKAAAYSLGGVAAHVAPSIGVRASRQSAGVALGGARYPMAGGAEFGSYRYRQFKPWRGNSSDAGYFVYPAIRRDADRIETEFTDAVGDLIKRVGLA